MNRHQDSVDPAISRTVDAHIAASSTPSPLAPRSSPLIPGSWPLTPDPSDKLHEECGVFGVYAPGEDVARLTYFGLYALQHRGQESAGIATTGGGDLMIRTRMGLVSTAFNEESLAGLTGHSAIGHTRYSTTGSSRLCNAQPLRLHDPALGWLALAHNGNVTNADTLQAELQGQGFS
ncbi:MAG: hypothetical protein M3328_11525, partial [Chloroflexota bacterium]|nr:hypothetical protein [Chloroflexota bacterium]